MDADIRDADGVMRLFAENRGRIEIIVHAAAQPSHDWAASDPETDFGVNAQGTLNLLQAARRHAADAPFIFPSTNKVYGDLPNHLPLVELDTRLELPETTRTTEALTRRCASTRSTHSLFGVSKAAADLMVQEYGRYFGMPTVCFRGGCLTGPNHAGAQLHGFLSYLMSCTITGERLHGIRLRGKQVRDNIHSADLVHAFDAYRESAAACRRLQHRRWAQEQLLDAGGDRGLRAIAGRELNWELSDARASATTAGGSPTSRRSRTTTPTGSSRYGIE